MKIGNQVGLGEDTNPLALAPLRKVAILGSRLDYPPVVTGTYARRLKTTGYLLSGVPLSLGCGPFD